MMLPLSPQWIGGTVDLKIHAIRWKEQASLALLAWGHCRNLHSFPKIETIGPLDDQRRKRMSMSLWSPVVLNQRLFRENLALFGYVSVSDEFVDRCMQKLHQLMIGHAWYDDVFEPWTV